MCISFKWVFGSVVTPDLGSSGWPLPDLLLTRMVLPITPTTRRTAPNNPAVNVLLTFSFPELDCVNFAQGADFNISQEFLWKQNKFYYSKEVTSTFRCCLLKQKEGTSYKKAGTKQGRSLNDQIYQKSISRYISKTVFKIIIIPDPF